MHEKFNKIYLKTKLRIRNAKHIWYTTSALSVTNNNCGIKTSGFYKAAEYIDQLKYLFHIKDKQISSEPRPVFSSDSL